MKGFIIFVKGHKASEAQALNCFNSCKDLGYDVMFLEGSTPDKMKVSWDYPEIEDARVRIFKKENYKKYLAKKACISNQYRLWKKCVELDEPILVLEHDAIAVKEWDSPEYTDMLVLNMKSAMGRSIARSVKPSSTAYDYKGVQDITKSGSRLIYNRENKYKDSYMPPGIASYMIKPRAAKILIESLDTDGWEQGDYFINTSKIKIEYTVPDYFVLNQNNLQLSHGV